MNRGRGSGDHFFNAELDDLRDSVQTADRGRGSGNYHLFRRVSDVYEALGLDQPDRGGGDFYLNRLIDRAIEVAGSGLAGSGPTGPNGTPLLDDFEREFLNPGIERVEHDWTTVDSYTESVIVDGELTADPEDENCAAQWTTSYAVPCEVWATLGPGDYEAAIYFDLLAAAGTEGGDATFEPYVNNDGDSSLWSFPGIGDSNGDSYPINDAPGPALAENDGIGFSYDGFTATAYHRAGADGEWSVVATGEDDSSLGAEGFLNLWNYGEGAASFKEFGGGSY